MMSGHHIKLQVQPFIIMLQFVHVYAFSNFGFNGKNAKPFRLGMPYVPF